MSDVLPTGFEDIPGFVERLVDYVFGNETLIRAQLMPGLSKSVRSYRKKIYARHLRKALRERSTNKMEIESLGAFIISTVRAEAIFDMRDMYGLTISQIKVSMRTMLELLLGNFANPVARTSNSGGSLPNSKNRNKNQAIT